MKDKGNAKKEIKELVDKYNRVAEEKRIGRYNEEMTKKDFLLPLFRSLGWNVEDSTEVSAEEKISRGRVDYSFRINGLPKFFLEAKPLKADLDKKEYIEQTINYAWHKGCTWAVLSDFEAVKIYNAELKTSSPMQSHLKTIPCYEYLDRFEELWLLSKAGFEEGLIDKEAEKWGKKTKKAPVDKQLLSDFTRFRELLSKNIMKLNSSKDLTEEDLDESVQRILDRLIFIRNCEDRGLEEKGLWEAKNEKNIPRKLKELFSDYDKNYNSKIFALHLCDALTIDNDILHEIIEGLYYTKDKSVSYDFSAIEADVLGSIYEQYLGHILKKSEKRAKLTKDHAHRKEQGIYYTPTYIVDYIVRNTLGELLKNKNINAEKIRVLDPACGSGSFLIKTFDLLNEHYSKHDKNYNQPQFDFKTGKSFSAKSKILQNNIFGVDLDRQAVEIAQLNLLLKIAEKGHRLPLLQENIKCGNSLIDDPAIAGDKAFKWEEEFKQIMDEGGFDVVVGNPPYIKEYTNKSAFDGLHNNSYYQGKMDIWTLFACCAIDLLKDGGYFSFIAPNNWLTNAGASIFRDKILLEGQIIKFVDFGDFKVFIDAGIQTMIFVFKKGKPKRSYQTTYAKVLDKNIGENSIKTLLQSNLKAGDDGIVKFEAIINPKRLLEKNIMFPSQANDEILNKIESKKNFELTIKEIAQGIVAAPDKYFIIDDISSFNQKEQEFMKPFYTSTAKYTFSKANAYIFYLCDKNFGNKNINDYPHIKNHFEPFKKVLKDAKKKYGTPDKPYFYLHREREEKFFQKGQKVVGQTRTAFQSFLYTEETYYGSRAMNFIKTDRINLKYLTGLLNSRLSYFWLKNKGKQLGDLLQIDKGPLLNIPLLKPDAQGQEQVAQLVDKVTKLYQDFRNTSANTDKWHWLKSEIKKVEQQIDEIIYKLYGLTAKEIKTIEAIQ